MKDNVALEKVPPGGLDALSPKDIRERVNLIQKIIAEVMKPEVHYYTVQGSDKPALAKAGAEVILLTFKLSLSDIEVLDLSVGDVERRYRVLTTIRAGDGSIVGVGIGECSTAEEKYAWRKAVCQEEWDAADPGRRRVKYKRDGEGHKTILQVATEPADNANTVLKMAKKRSMVDAVLTSTAASDCFEQDLDELPPDEQAERTKGRKARGSGGGQGAKGQPQATVTAKHEAAIKAVTHKAVGNGGTLWTINTVDGEMFKTFSENIGHAAEECVLTGEVVTIRYTTDKYGKKAEDIEPLDNERAPGDDEPSEEQSAPKPQPESETRQEANTEPAVSRDAALADLRKTREQLGVSWDQVREIAGRAGANAKSSAGWTSPQIVEIIKAMWRDHGPK